MNTFFLKKDHKIAILSIRNLGDSVILSKYIIKLASQFSSITWVVWARPGINFLYKDYSNIEVVNSYFPIGTNNNFHALKIFNFLAVYFHLLKLKPLYTVDFIGDSRELLLGLSLFPKKHLNITWAKKHQFNNLILKIFKTRKPFVTIPLSCKNIYQAYEIMSDKITFFLEEEGFKKSKVNNFYYFNKNKNKIKAIGLHPFASQECKMWPLDNWIKLVCELRLKKFKLFLFCSPDEADKAKNIFKKVLDDLEIISVDLSELPIQLKKIKLMVGLDSFSVHLAHKYNIQSIMLVGGNSAELWTPPNGFYIKTSKQLDCQPCFNKPTCVNTKNQYLCLTSIEVKNVIKIIDEKFE